LDRKTFTLSILIAALYAALTILLAPISFSAIFQVRLADALIPLSYNRRVGRAAIYGTTLGTIVSNMFSFYGFYDILLGSAANFFASLIPYMLRYHKGLAAKLTATTLSCLTVIFFVGFILFNRILGVPLETSISTIAFGSIVSIMFLGTLLLLALERVFGEKI